MSIFSIKRLIYPLFFTLMFALASPLAATAMTNSGIFAQDVLGPSVDCSNPAESQSAVCVTSQHADPIYGNGGLFEKITGIVSIVAGGAAVLLMIVAGIRFVVSGGDANKVSGAKSTIVGCLIGIAVIVLARSLINFIVNRI